MRALARKRVRALTVLTRIKDQEIDEVTVELRRLQDRLGHLRAERRDMERRLEENARTDTLEGSFFIARYARAVRVQISTLDHQIAEITPRSDALEARMRGLFAEAKTYESLQGRIQLEELRSRQKREAEALEEMFLLRRASQTRPGLPSGS